MNTERLYTVLQAVQRELHTSNVLVLLQELANHFQQVSVNPGNANSQQHLARLRKQLSTALSSSPSDSYSPAWRQILEDTKGSEFLGARLLQHIEGVFNSNNLTPAAAHQSIVELLASLKRYSDAVSNCISSFVVFDFEDESLDPGDAEFAVLIPRRDTDSLISAVAKELEFVNRLVATMSEIATGSVEPVRIRTVSSSDFMMFVDAGLRLAEILAVCISSIVDTYKNVLEIRAHKTELTKQNVPADIIERLEDHATRVIEQRIDEIAPSIIDKYCDCTDSGRRNELVTSVKLNLRYLADRIDRGFNFEVRVEPVTQTDPEGETQISIEVIQNATPSMQYLRLEGDPVLKLPSADPDASVPMKPAAPDKSNKPANTKPKGGGRKKSTS